MNLINIREDFVKRCGRYDLVKDGWKDNGADFFIRAGQRLLDKRGDFGSGQEATFRATLRRGEHTVYISNCWAVQRVTCHAPTWPKHVWVAVPSSYSREAFQCCFGSLDLAYIVKPNRSLPRIKERTPASDVVGSASQYESPAAQFASWEKEQGLVLEMSKPIRHKLDLIIYGKFFSEPLKEDNDFNYWTDRWPETLLKAALYELEVFYRNTEGAKDWLDAIEKDMRDIEQMQLFQDIGPKDEMRGWY